MSNIVFLEETRGKKWEEDTPKLLLRLRTAVSGTKEELLPQLVAIWEHSLMELAFGSAISGGIVNPTQDLKELTEAQRLLMFDRHLKGHAQMGHFNIKSDSKIERTGNMYLLLKSLGSKQPQREIATFESIPFVREVKAAAINQRLALARKSGYLPADPEQETTSNN